MNLFEGLEQFGFKTDATNLFEDEKKANTNTDNNNESVEKIPTEDEFLIEKKCTCPVCDKEFKTRVVKSSKARRLEADPDLRPRYQYIDTIKYDMYSCPHCGYSAMSRYFDHLSSVQVKLIKEQLCNNFKSVTEELPETYDYDYAIDRYKLALYTAVAKKSKASEKAYNCLKLAWLYRGKAESLDKTATDYETELKACKDWEERFYEQAYEGFMKAVSAEMFPICNMDQNTMDYLLAYMAMHFKRFDVASKCIANILQSPSAQSKTKERARDLKEQIVAEIKKCKEQ